MVERKSDDAAERSYTRDVGAVVFVCCLALAVFNFIVNPFNFYPTRLGPRFLFSDAIVKAQLMKKSAPPEALILGSSRTMALSPSDVYQMTGLKTFNAGIRAAAPEDVAAVLQYALRDCGWHPRLLIIGVDVPYCCVEHPGDENLLAESQMAQYLPANFRRAWFCKGIDGLVSMSQTNDSLKAIHAAFSPSAAPPQEYSIDADGLMHFDLLEKLFTHGYPSGMAQLNIINKFFGAFPAPKQDAMQKLVSMQKLDEIVRTASERHMKILIFITPYHPKLLAMLQKSSPFNYLRRSLVSHLDGLKRTYPGLAYEDLTDISSFGGDPVQFYDWVHCRPPNAHRILSRLLLSPRSQYRRHIAVDPR
ncbi:MAG: hypothetical protein M3Y56_02160 [Armatimonadota bacterium]|nr:hypothetical protein [Armatimonadota bacterium]